MNELDQSTETATLAVLHPIAAMNQRFRAMYEEHLTVIAWAETNLPALFDKLSDKAEANACSGSVWCHADNRDDLKAFMSLAPRWEKGTDADIMEYRAQVDGIPIIIKAQGEAIPPTCHVIEEEVEVPAQPAHTVKRSRIVCNQSAEVAHA
jgi:hypothetical protein